MTKTFEIDIVTRDASGDTASVPLEFEAPFDISAKDAATNVAHILKEAPSGGIGTVKPVADDH